MTESKARSQTERGWAVYWRDHKDGMKIRSWVVASNARTAKEMVIHNLRRARLNFSILKVNRVVQRDR